MCHRHTAPLVFAARSSRLTNTAYVQHAKVCCMCAEGCLPSMGSFHSVEMMQSCIIPAACRAMLMLRYLYPGAHLKCLEKAISSVSWPHSAIDDVRGTPFQSDEYYLCPALCMSLVAEPLYCCAARGGQDDACGGQRREPGAGRAAACDRRGCERARAARHRSHPRAHPRRRRRRRGGAAGPP